MAPTSLHVRSPLQQSSQSLYSSTDEQTSVDNETHFKRAQQTMRSHIPPTHTHTHTHTAAPPSHSSLLQLVAGRVGLLFPWCWWQNRWWGGLPCFLFLFCFFFFFRAPLSVSDAFQSSWPAPGSRSSPGAERCSVCFTSQLSPPRLQAQEIRADARELLFFFSPFLHRFEIRLFIFCSLCIIIIIIIIIITVPELRMLHGSDTVACSRGYSAS